MSNATTSAGHAHPRVHSSRWIVSTEYELMSAWNEVRAGLDGGDGGVVEKGFQMTSGIVIPLVVIGALGIAFFVLASPSNVGFAPNH